MAAPATYDELQEMIESGKCPHCSAQGSWVVRPDDPGLLNCVNCNAMEDYCPVPGCGGLLAGECCPDCGWPEVISEDAQ